MFENDGRMSLDSKVNDRRGRLFAGKCQSSIDSRKTVASLLEIAERCPKVEELVEKRHNGLPDATE